MLDNPPGAPPFVSVNAIKTELVRRGEGPPLLFLHPELGIAPSAPVLEKLAAKFAVTAPSLPGYGFSGKPTTTGWGVDRIAAAWATLMARLGYARYGAQGGDWGSAVTASLGAQDPAHCAGIHVTLAMASRPAEGDTSPEAMRALAGIKHYRDWDSGYSKQQSTRLAPRCPRHRGAITL